MPNCASTLAPVRLFLKGEKNTCAFPMITPPFSKFLASLGGKRSKGKEKEI